MNKQNIEEWAEYGVDSRYKSREEQKADGIALMEGRLERMKNLPQEQIIRARLMQLKLKMKYFEYLPIFGNFKKNRQMKNTSISLGNYFDQFVSSQVSAGRYKNVSEVIRAGLRLLENEENQIIALRNAIQEGIDSGIVHDFDPQKHLEALKARRKNEG